MFVLSSVKRLASRIFSLCTSIRKFLLYKWMVIRRVDKIVAFDFDDTLAETGSLIGARFKSGDESFEDFIFENNICFVEFSKGFWWIDSANYALLEDLTPPIGHELEFDYAQTMNIDLESITTITPMIRLMKEYMSDPDTLVLIVTARAGEAKTYSPSLQEEVVSSNRRQIKKFLNERYAPVPDRHIHTVGDTMDDTSLAKAYVLSEYLMNYNPSELIFYDDSERNLRSVSRVCASRFPDIKMSMMKVVDGIVFEYYDRDKKGIKERLREILSTILE